MDKLSINTALVSVTDKTNIAILLKGLAALNPQLKIIASGGTSSHLTKEGISHTFLKDFTGFPECFSGRVKTLHPKIAGGILFRKNKDESQAKEVGIEPIDLVVCNLYDFASATQQYTSMDQLVEHMDIGGSTLIRSAVKNYASVALLTDPDDYEDFLQEVRASYGIVSIETREKLAVKGIGISARYEALLHAEFSKRLSKHVLINPDLENGKSLRYGENPDQKGWVFSLKDHHGIAQSKQLSGKELSFNNYEDATVAFSCIGDLKEVVSAYGVAIVKHGSLCALATAKDLPTAFERAWQGDSKSSFGSVIAFSHEVKEDIIDHLKNRFIELLIAPNFSPEFVCWAKEKKPLLRLLSIEGQSTPYHYKNISGGMLVQSMPKKISQDTIAPLFQAKEERKGGVTKRRVPIEKLNLFAFGLIAVKFAKSNAVAIVREIESNSFQLLGLGAGQPNRVDCLQRLAIPKALENIETFKEDPEQVLSEAVLASDGFFPFEDSINFASDHYIKWCVQPGGSKMDEKVIAAADANDMGMIFTGQRYFFH
ncbi:MAG: bifunctional phosphoribosylaminoimidazolecarboxamide formyltransferase/IMP cyclohydrolase [Chlamydiota bacterium]|jgi:phosphoribosylaminoimidazolecarboxamide formyltransferase/IMP cyclohydrolase